MKANISLFLYISIFIVLVVAAGIVVFKQKPIQPTPMHTLFVYDPKKGIGTENLVGVNINEPAFSIKLPDNWYFEKNRTGNKRLIVQSPTTIVKGYEFRAIITISIVPTNNNLDAEVAIAKKEISKLTIGNKLLVAKPITINGYPAYQLEYTLKREQDADVIKKIIGADGPFTENVDMIAVKNGYLVDIAATSFFWQWKDYVTTIQKSLNSFKFLEQ